MKNAFTANDEAVTLVARDQRRAVEAGVLIMPNTGFLSLIEGVAGTLRHRIPIFDWRVAPVG